MHFEPEHIYHVYNRGNNKIRIFFGPHNYLFLPRKVKQEWLRFCDIFCYCLMPNHFHFMLQAKTEACEDISLKGRVTHLQNLSKTIGKTLSSYTQAINIQNQTTGNLFQKKTKAKCLTDVSMSAHNYTSCDYLINCFHYIHNNPLKATLVKQLKDWPYSSWLDYYGERNGNLCNKKLAMDRIGLTQIDLINSNEIIVNPALTELIW